MHFELEFNTEILEFNQCQKSDKKRFFYNIVKNATTKVTEHISSGFSISTTSSFEEIENKRDIYRSRDCIEKFFKCLKKLRIKSYQ